MSYRKSIFQSLIDDTGLHNCNALLSPYQLSLTHTSPYLSKYQYLGFLFCITIVSGSLRSRGQDDCPPQGCLVTVQLNWAQIHLLLLDDPLAMCRQLAVDEPHLIVPRRVSPVLPSSATSAMGYALLHTKNLLQDWLYFHGLLW